MKYITIFIITFWSQFIFGQFEKTNKALIFIDSLKTEKNKKTKQYHLSSNRYLLTDLDNDGIIEVIEIANKIEDDIPGFLPIELSFAFDYHILYSFNNRLNKFILKNTSDFKIYQKEREYFYKAWYSLISNPKDLNQNLKDLVNENKKYFLNELNKLLIEVKN
jgi:hypothetical protein